MKASLFLILLLSSQAWAKWSVSTYNIRNFDNDSREGRTNLTELGKIIKTAQSDVMTFIEVVNAEAFSKLIKTNLQGYSYSISNCGGGGKQKLAIAYNLKIFDLVSEVEDLSFSGSGNKCGSLRPVFLVTLMHKASKKLYTFGAVHLKAGGSLNAMERRWEQYNKLEKLSESYASKNLILLGDFNTTGYNIQDRDYEKFEDLLTGGSLRTTSESIACTSYWAGTSGGKEHVSSILDHVVVQDKLMNTVADVSVGAHCAQMDCRSATPRELGKSYENVSDHCPVRVTFK